MGTTPQAVSEKSYRVLYAYLLTSGNLNSYLAAIERQTEEMFSRLVKQIAEVESITEELKVEEQMTWVVLMNSICSRGTEIVNTEIIYC